MKITVVYDNSAMEGLNSGWGFSCLIEDGKNILFDCGDNAEKLINNMRKLGIDPKGIDIIFLSHEHWDHTGGLLGILDVCGDVTVYVPRSFSTEMKERIRSKARVKEVGARELISENAYSTGELRGSGGVAEQSMALETPKGIFIITGCAHPGLNEIILKSRELGKVYGIMGGFHDFSDFGILKDMGLVACCHCTQHGPEIKRLFPDSCRSIRAGSVIVL